MFAYDSIIAGSITAGCFSTIVGHPLDTLKVLQQQKQINLHPRYYRILFTKFFYRGIGPPMINQILMNSIMFSTFQRIKDISSSMSSSPSSSSSSSSASLCAGLISGFVTACVSTPFDWIKIQAQLTIRDTKDGNSSIGKTIRKNVTSYSIVKELLHENQYQVSKVTRVLYTGHIANLAREGVFTMVYLGIYDIISNIVKQQKKDKSSNNNFNNNHLDTTEIILISSFTGAFAWICNYPFDTMKTVMQGQPYSQQNTTNQMSIRSAFMSIYKGNNKNNIPGGMKAFYCGVGPSTLRAMLVTSTRMFAFEKTIQLIEQ